MNIQFCHSEGIPGKLSMSGEGAHVEATAVFVGGAIFVQLPPDRMYLAEGDVTAAPTQSENIHCEIDVMAWMEFFTNPQVDALNAVRKFVRRPDLVSKLVYVGCDGEIVGELTVAPEPEPSA